MIRFLTAGESHGKALTVILEGIPANLKVDVDYINHQLKRRQSGYGRGNRMKIESDKVEVLSGLRFGKTLGTPITLQIENKDWVNWQDKLDPYTPYDVEKISIPRPGHADLNGIIKYNYDDIRNVIERASARETAARTAAGALCKIFLEHFEIYTGSFVESIGGVFAKDNFVENIFNNKNVIDAKEIASKADESIFRVLDRNHEDEIKKTVDDIIAKGDTAGGTFYVIATGLIPGLGSYVHFDKKLDADIALSIMSINAVKGVEIGKGFNSSIIRGSQNNDEIFIDGESFSRRTNFAGGIEGGITTGLPIIVRAAMKPISTLAEPINSIDLSTMEETKSRWERSDFAAVPACAVIAEGMLAYSLANALLSKFGGDSIEEIERNFMDYKLNYFNQVKENFSKDINAKD
ncbi:MAG TPA: chorismate synthase [Ignavibacteriaceae bacterium]|nr:chorismate synthase [Ignavibacteriaceae bacterium]